MQLLLRRCLAMLAGSGFMTSLGVYIASFGGLTVNNLGTWFFMLHAGVFAVFAPMCLVELRGLPMVRQRLFWMQFKAGKPAWVVQATQAFGFFALLNFVIFLVQSHASSPDIVNNRFVLNDHGTIRKLITEREYLWLKGDELRLFASGWLFFYARCAAYWWFPGWRQSQHHAELRQDG